MEPKTLTFSYPCEAHVVVHNARNQTTKARRTKVVEILREHYTYWSPGIVDVWFRMAADDYHDEETDIFTAGYPAAWIIQVHGAPELEVPVDGEEVLYSEDGWPIFFFRLLPPTDVWQWDIVVDGGSITTIDQQVMQWNRSIDRDQNDLFWCDAVEELFYLPQLFGEARYEAPFEPLWE